MRIIKEWNKSELKLTLLKMNERFSIKAEKNLLEQTFKFRDGAFQNPEELINCLDDNFYNRINVLFEEMKTTRQQLFKKHEDTFQFPDII